MGWGLAVEREFTGRKGKTAAKGSRSASEPLTPILLAISVLKAATGLLDPFTGLFARGVRVRFWLMGGFARRDPPLGHLANAGQRFRFNYALETLDSINFYKIRINNQYFI
jgi:hypothetical protein